MIEPSYDSILSDKNNLTSAYCFVISSIRDDLVSDKSFFYPSILTFRIASTSFIFLPSYSFNSSFAVTYEDVIDFWRVVSKSANSFWAPSCLLFIDDFISSFCFVRFKWSKDFIEVNVSTCFDSFFSNADFTFFCDSPISLAKSYFTFSAFSAWESNFLPKRPFIMPKLSFALSNPDLTWLLMSDF